jgi:hypothetical protein
MVLPVRFRALVLVPFLLAACTHSPRAIPHDAPDAAAAYFAAKRGNVDVVARWSAAREQLLSVSRRAVVIQPNPWTFLGPGNIGGRTRPLVIDPNQPDVIYAGAVSGGVFKTTDAGASWIPTGDAMANLAVNSLAMSPADSQTLFAGTGEGYFREDVRGTAVAIRGDGIFVTRDGAASWTQLPSTKNNEDFHWVNDLAISTHDPHRIYAATRTGVWRSNDEGTNWTRVLPTTVKGGCLDLALRAGTEGDYLFASCGVFDQATVYRAKNAESDDAWEPVLSVPGMSRTSLAIAPSNPSVVYAMAAENRSDPNDQVLLGVFRSDQNGDAGSWTLEQKRDGSFPGSLLLENPYSGSFSLCTDGHGTAGVVPMGWHCNTLAVDPTNPNRLWAGGVDVFRSEDGGKTWGVASFWWDDHSSHADHHSIVFDPRYDGSSNQRMYVTNDGGVYRTDNAGAAVATGEKATCDLHATKVLWTSLNHNYGGTQFYHGLPTADGKSFLGGTQDNGTVIGGALGRDTSTDGWKMIWGGDGGFVAVDPNRPKVTFAESQNGAIVRASESVTGFLSYLTLSEESFLFITPFTLDPNETLRLWSGSTRLLRRDSPGTPWVFASKQLDGHVTSIAVAPGNSSRVIAGSTAGSIYRSTTAVTDNGATWQHAHPRDGWVSSVSFDPTDTNIVYATYALFGGTHVFRSTDAGVSWTASDDGIPDIATHALAVDPANPSNLYLGTDLGVFTSNDSGAHWSHDDTLPPVITEWVTIGRGSWGPALYAFTHGRGVWRMELTPAPQRRRTGPR